MEKQEALDKLSDVLWWLRGFTGNPDHNCDAFDKGLAEKAAEVWGWISEQPEKKSSV